VEVGVVGSHEVVFPRVEVEHGWMVASSLENETFERSQTWPVIH